MEKKNWTVEDAGEEEVVEEEEKKMKKKGRGGGALAAAGTWPAARWRAATDLWPRARVKPRPWPGTGRGKM